MEQIHAALARAQLAAVMFLEFDCASFSSPPPSEQHLIPLIILPYVINWLSVVHCLPLSHGSNHSPANRERLLESLSLPLRRAGGEVRGALSSLYPALMTCWLPPGTKAGLGSLHVFASAAPRKPSSV